MNKTYNCLDERAEDYINSLFNEDDALKFIRENAQKKGLPSIQVCAQDARHLEVLARLSQAKKIVEIGTLGGYSGTALARGLQPNGKLYTFELKSDFADVAKEGFQRANIADKVEIHVGAALENLSKIEKEGPFDLVFIDADKVNYPNYLNWAAKNLRPSGVVIGDNTFAWGDMFKSNSETCAEDNDTVRGLRQFNWIVAHDSRFCATIFPTGEGLTVAVLK